MKEVQLIAKLADLQEAQYHNTLVLHAVIELLTAKDLLTPDEVAGKMQELDSQLTFQIEAISKLTDAVSSRGAQVKPYQSL